jgi:hypothetical protein
MEARRNGEGTLAMVRHTLENVKGREEILSFVDHLISERDELAKRQEHLSSLARLMEKTVSDADDMAAQIKKQAEEEAQNKVKELVGQAEERARQIIEETRAKALSDAQSEVLAVKSGAVQDLEALFKEQISRMLAQTKETTEGLHLEIQRQADESSRRLESFQAEFEKSLSTLVNWPGPGGVQAGVRAASTPAAGNPEKGSQPQVPASPAAAAGTSQHETQDGSDEQQVDEIEILPPRDKRTIEGIREYLARQDEIGLAEIEHLTDKSVIHAHLLRPLDMVERLSRLPEVEQAQEVTEGNRKKIAVLLSVNAEIEREREALNSKANRIASRISRLSR